MHTYFSGLGGVGIGPLAMLALDAGYRVSGSDLQPSPMTEELKRRKALVAIGQDGTQIARAHKRQPIDWLVYSSALPPDHPELRFARQHGIKTTKRADFLNLLLRTKQLKLLAVTGTHGKTTSTALFVWAFQQLGVPISYSVGTTLSFGPPAQYQPGSAYFVYECDEFDRNFLAFQPDLSLITSVDYDHPDTYPNENEYQAAFRQFARQSQQTFIWQADAEIFTKKDHITVLQESAAQQQGLQLSGSHNRENAYMVLAALQRLTNLKTATIVRALNNFPGTGRRFEKLADNLYTDYAHHPAEVKATIQLAQEINPQVVVVYQPHQNQRQHEILKSNGYQTGFTGAKKIYWLPTYLSREDKNLKLLEPAELSKNVKNVELAALNDDLWQKIKAHQQTGDLVVAMSAGDLDPWLRQKLSDRG